MTITFVSTLFFVSRSIFKNENTLTVKNRKLKIGENFSHTRSKCLLFGILHLGERSITVRFDIFKGADVSQKGEKKKDVAAALRRC